MPCPSAFNGLHLCEAAIHKQFRSRDEAAVVGCEKHHRLRDVIGCTDPGERNTVGDRLQALLARFRGMSCGRVGKPWAHRVHANAAILQVRRPCPGERTHGGFCGAINALLRQPFTGDNGRIQDDRGAIRQQRKRLLHREKRPHIGVEDRVIVLLSYLAQEGKLEAPAFANTISSLPFSCSICAKRRSRSPRFDTSPCTPVTFIPISVTAAANSGSRRPVMKTYAFVHELLRCRKANAAIATRDECSFSFKLTHVFLLRLQQKFSTRCLQ